VLLADVPPLAEPLPVAADPEVELFIDVELPGGLLVWFVPAVGLVLEDRPPLPRTCKNADGFSTALNCARALAITRDAKPRSLRL
jgi:hypothetical protein